MSCLSNLSNRTIRKTTEVDGKVKYEDDLAYDEYCQDLANLLYDKVACGYKTRIRWSSSCSEHGVHMPTAYWGNGTVVRYKVVD